MIVKQKEKERQMKRTVSTGEKIEPLGNGRRIVVSNDHKFGTDTVLLAHFSRPGKNDKACELGTGCGAIPLIWSRDDIPAKVTAVEIQEEACGLLKKSILLNGLEERIEVILSDLRDLRGKVSFSDYDIVVCNPPYKAAGTGIINPEESHRIARHEADCTADDIIAVAARLLRFSGRLCMCQRPERLSDLICSMRKHDIEPKRLRFVQQRMKKEPKLFLIEGRRGGKPNGLRVEPTLFIENESGGLSEEMIKIYGAYKEEYL